MWFEPPQHKHPRLAELLRDGKQIMLPGDTRNHMTCWGDSDLSQRWLVEAEAERREAAEFQQWLEEAEECQRWLVEAEEKTEEKIEEKTEAAVRGPAAVVPSWLAKQMPQQQLAVTDAKTEEKDDVITIDREEEEESPEKKRRVMKMMDAEGE